MDRGITYLVKMDITGNVSIWLEADDEDEAKSMAENIVENMDFGVLRDIEWNITKIAEDE